MPHTKRYWDSLYSSNSTGWDVGYISTPLKEYFDQLTNKNIRILIPGAGKAWEAEYLYKLGFKNTFILEFSEEAIMEFTTRCPWFPVSQIVSEDFFAHSNKYDLIVEQTFFSSLTPLSREKYVNKICDLLVDTGKYMGVLFNHEFDFEGPPFGGSVDEYVELFKPIFNFIIFETAFNSIKPRQGREVFLLLKKK
ncbi:MAG: SAM-dependent methyltransferase [Bacteroidota bacterium]